MIGAVVWPESPTGPGQQGTITESDVVPGSRPQTFSQLLDAYLTTVQETLREEAKAIHESGLTEVKLTIRKDGTLASSEVVVLDGPAMLRSELLPLVKHLEPLPPPPISADMVDVSILLPLGYPGPDLLDSVDQNP
jgi:outer membrane biosynthesis protein TonB